MGEGNADRETKARQAGAEWYRIIVTWSQIEPNAPVGGIHTYNWSVYDNLISGLRQRGLHPLVEVRFAPDSTVAFWAIASGQPSCGLLSTEGLQAYSEFMAALVERSDGDGVGDMAGSPVVRYWEIGNEVDKHNPPSGMHYGLCYGGKHNEYAQLLARSWDAIHGADAAAQVVFGGMAYENCCGFDSDPRSQVSGPDFFDSVLSYIKNNPRPVGQYFDVMNVHAYSSFMHLYNPPDERTKYQIVRNKLVNCACGLNDVPLMNTEGGRRSDGGQTAWGQAGSPERQSRYVPQMYVRGLASGLKAAFWYAMMDYGGLGYGLLTAGNEPKKAYWAYKTLTEEMTGFTYMRTLTTVDTGSVDIEGYAFENANQKQKWVVYIPPQKEGVTRNMAFPFSRVRRVAHEKYEGVSGTPIPGAVKEIADGDTDDLGPAGDGKVTLQVTVDPIYVEDISGAMAPLSWLRFLGWRSWLDQLMVAKAW